MGFSEIELLGIAAGVTGVAGVGSAVFVIAVDELQPQLGLARQTEHGVTAEAAGRQPHAGDGLLHEGEGLSSAGHNEPLWQELPPPHAEPGLPPQVLHPHADGVVQTRAATSEPKWHAVVVVHGDGAGVEQAVCWTHDFTGGWQQLPHCVGHCWQPIKNAGTIAAV